MSAPLSVTTRTEALRRIISTTSTAAWEFSIWEEWADGEPRICDTDAAARLGFKAPRQVRELIERTWAEGQRPKTRSVIRQQPTGNGGTRKFTVTEYWLTEAELLKLCARARTDAAEAILDEMIRVFIAVRRHLIESVPVRAHERTFPNAPKQLTAPPKVVRVTAPRNAPSPLPPIGERLDSPACILNGVPQFDIVVRIAEADLTILRAVSDPASHTVEETVKFALVGWVYNAVSLGVHRR